MQKWEVKDLQGRKVIVEIQIKRELWFECSIFGVNLF